MYILRPASFLQKGRNLEAKEHSSSSMSTSPRRVVTSVPRCVTDLATAAVVEPRQLALLSDKLLAELCKENKMGLNDRVIVETYVARVRAEKMSVGEVADRQEQLKLYPWLEAESRATRLWDRFTADYSASADPFAALRTSFEANARAGLISTETSLVLSYVLYTTDPNLGRFLLASLLLNVPQEQRLATHNWALAQEMESSRKFALGDNIARLTAPLWPPQCAGADTLNAKLLRACDGSGEAPAFSPGGLVSGAGWLPVQQQGDGAYGVETAPLDAIIKGELDSLRAEIRALRTQQQQPVRGRRGGGGGGRGQQFQDPQQYQHQQYRGQQQQQQPYHQQQQQYPQQHQPYTRERRPPAGAGGVTQAQQQQPQQPPQQQPQMAPSLEDIFKVGAQQASAPPPSPARRF